MINTEQCQPIDEEGEQLTAEEEAELAQLEAAYYRPAAPDISDPAAEAAELAELEAAYYPPDISEEDDGVISFEQYNEKFSNRSTTESDRYERQLYAELLKREEQERPPPESNEDDGDADDEPDATEDAEPEPPKKEWPQFDEKEAIGGPIEKAACGVCGRHFACERLERHMKACAESRMRSKKRKTFDVRSQRWQDTDNAPLVKTAIKRGDLAKPNPVEQASAREAKRRKWQRESLAIRRAAAAGKTNGSGFEVSGLDVGLVEEEVDDRVQCPHCLRKFAPLPAERHIAKCQDIRAKPSTLKRTENGSTRADQVRRMSQGPNKEREQSALGKGREAAAAVPALNLSALGGHHAKDAKAKEAGSKQAPVRKAPPRAAPPASAPPQPSPMALVDEAHDGGAAVEMPPPPPPPPSELDQLHALGDAKFGKPRYNGLNRPPTAPPPLKPQTSNSSTASSAKSVSNRGGGGGTPTAQARPRRQSSGYGQINPLARKPSAKSNENKPMGPLTSRARSPSTSNRSNNASPHNSRRASTASQPVNSGRNSREPSPGRRMSTSGSARSNTSNNNNSSRSNNSHTGAVNKPAPRQTAAMARPHKSTAATTATNPVKSPVAPAAARRPVARKPAPAKTLAPAAAHESPRRAPLAPKTSSKANTEGGGGGNDAAATAALPFFKVAPPQTPTSINKPSFLRSPSAKSPDSLHTNNASHAVRGGFGPAAAPLASPRPMPPTAPQPLQPLASPSLNIRMPMLSHQDSLEDMAASCASPTPFHSSGLFDRQPTQGFAKRPPSPMRGPMTALEDDLPAYQEVRVERFGWRRSSFISRRDSVLLETR